MLIVDDPQRLVFARQAQHCLDEIPALTARTPDAVQSARADDQMLWTFGSDHIFAAQFADAVNADRAGGIVNGPRRRPRGVQAEDIVRAEMNQRAPQIAAIARQRT